MKNRLELFREKIAAFDGAADPSRAITRDYVVEEPRQASTDTLLKRISLRPQSKNLLIGGIGAGKTTQLLKLQRIFRQSSELGIYAHYVDVTEYTRIDNLQVGILEAIIGLELVKLLEENSFHIDESRSRTIEEFAYGYDESLLNVGPLRVPGVLPSRPRSPSSLGRLDKVLLSLVKDFRASSQQTPYFLFDGLDRVDDLEKFARITSLNLHIFEIGFLIVGAASFLYSNFADSINSFNHIEYRSAFDVERSEEAYTFFERVLLTRSGKDFFQKSALTDLIISSGGVLRDLINLAQESIQEAYLADAEAVDQEHVGKAVLSMGRAKLLGLTKEQYHTLKTLTKISLETPTSPEEIYLLSSGRILEYRFPDRRFDIHPVLKKLLA